MLYFTHGELSDLNGSIVGVMSLKSFLSISLHLLLLDAYSGLRTSRQTNGGQFPELFTLMISNNGPPPAPCKI